MPRSFLVRSKRAGHHSTRFAHSQHPDQSQALERLPGSSSPDSSRPTVCWTDNSTDGAGAEHTPVKQPSVYPPDLLLSSAAVERPSDLERLIQALLSHHQATNVQTPLCECQLCAK
ncbi:hypothetical protein F2P79_002568, partial [Pimephales promelas]